MMMRDVAQPAKSSRSARGKREVEREPAREPVRNPDVRAFQSEEELDYSDDTAPENHLDLDNHYQQAYSNRDQQEKIAKHELQFLKKT